MSTPRTLTLDRQVRRADTSTERGTFASLAASPRDTALPHGNVLFVPGFTGSKEDFAALLPLLAETGWNAATFDQRGQFESPARSGDDFSVAGLARDLVALSRALHGDAEWVHLVGHSFGGLVAAAAAIDYAAEWASLTLLCSGPGGLGGPKAQQARDAADLIEREGLEAAYLAKAELDFQRGFEAPSPDIERFLRRRFLANSPESLAAIARQLADAGDRTADLVGLDLPVSVMRGADDDAWPHAVQDSLAEALGTKVVVIADSAHSPAVEAPEATRDALARVFMR